MVTAREVQEAANNSGLNLSLGWPSIHWPNISIPHLGPVGWLGLGLIGIVYGIKHGRIFVNPPPYEGCVVNRDPLPGRTTREYRDPRTGEHEEIQVSVKGVDGKITIQKVLRQETFWEPHGRYIKTIINYPGHWVDEHDWICPVGERYDPEKGEYVEIKEVQAVSVDQDLARSLPNPNKWMQKGSQIKRGVSGIGGYIDQAIFDTVGYKYIGNWLVVDWVAKHDWVWFERRSDGSPFRRRRRQRFFSLTVKTSALRLEEELIDRFGFPWKVKASVQTEPSNLNIAILQVPDSMPQLTQMAAGYMTQGWQGLKIIDYEGLEGQVKIINGEVVPPSPVEVTKGAVKSGIKIGGNQDIQELLFNYLKESDGWRTIMNRLGRNVISIIIESKTLRDDYADAIAKVRKAELSKQEMIKLSEGKEQAMKNVARGMEAQIKVVKEGESAGIAMVESGALNEKGNVPMDPLQKLATATLYPNLAKVQRGEDGESVESRSPQDQNRQKRGGDKRQG